MREYIEDLWYRRSTAEWQLLIRAAAGRALPPSLLVTDLQLRGLLTAQGQPFSELFRQVIKESLPKGKSLEAAADDIDTGTERAIKILDRLTYLARQAGRIRIEHPLFATTRRFFSAAGFEISDVLDDPQAFLCRPVHATWEQRFKVPLYMRLFPDQPLDRKAVATLYKEAQIITERAKVCLPLSTKPVRRWLD